MKSTSGMEIKMYDWFQGRNPLNAEFSLRFALEDHLLKRLFWLNFVFIWSTLKFHSYRNFYDILSEPAQFDYFKRFLVKEKSETPLLFWSAVESMRTMSKSGKARQGRATGIVKRYFGASTDFGKLDSTLSAMCSLIF